ncbi:dehydrogenase/reductase SDR family protein 7-like [Lycorma delicatula]|uniref:dehydrogenase/reductase SDR family protein 7-like n=1 Tax=Lycorma delicatula TaxID=130591 RepID=UPI003F516091
MASAGWPLFWWLVGSICIPLSLPWLLFKIFHFKKSHAKLQGKVVVITGASSGLGEALAHVFYKAGCKVILIARRENELARVKNDLLSLHPTIPTHPPVIISMDLSELNDIAGHVKKILAVYNKVDILINNAGISYRGEIISTKVDVDIKVMLINYFGQIALTKALLPSMVELRSGHIVAISSIQGRIALPYRSAYTASKHALQAFCDTLRAEVAGHNIKVTVVSPGYIRTNLSVNAVTGSGQQYGVLDETTAGGYSPQSVAEQILDGVADDKNELLISPASPRIAIFLRTVCPSLYFLVMKKRAKHTTSDKNS